MNQQQINNTFTYHRPTADQAFRYQAIRDAAKNFAELLRDTTPDSREKSVAFTKLQECTMWANASIAINEKGAE